MKICIYLMKIFGASLFKEKSSKKGRYKEMKKSKKIVLMVCSIVFALLLGATMFIATASVEVEPYSLGDINGDGKISVTDACLAFRIATNIDIATSEQEYSGDIDGNGEVTVSDARKILRIAVGIDLVPEVVNKKFTEIEFSVFEKTCADLSAIEDKYLNYNGEVEDELIEGLLNEVLLYAEEQKNIGNIISYELGTDSVRIELSSGLVVVFVPTQFGRLNSGSNLKIATLEPASSELFFKYQLAIYSGLEYKESYSLSTNADFIKNNINDYVHEKTLKNKDITIEELKNLKNYSVIIWEGHGGHNNTDHSFLQLSKKIKNLEEVNEHNKNGDFSYRRIISTQKGYYCITSEFIDEYFKGCNTNPLVFLGACSTLKDNVLANSFVSNGAAAVYGYTGVTSTDYNFIMRTHILLYLSDKDSNENYYTTQEALNMAKATVGHKDIFKPYTSELDLYPQNSSFRLTDNMPKSTTGIVKGTVKENNDSGKVLQGVTVKAYNLNSNDTRNVPFTSTNIKGEFELFLSGGLYRLEFSLTKNKQEYITKTIDISVKANATQSTDTIFLVKVGTILEIPYGYIAIYTPEDLNNIRNNLKGNYILMNDIDLSNWGNWASIGNETNPFSGILDGNGYIITSLTIDAKDKNHIGLFGYIKNAQIKDLGISKSTITVSSQISIETHVGGLAGSVVSSSISNCYNSTQINIQSSLGGTYLGGGIAGMVTSSTIAQSYNDGNITYNSNNVDTSSSTSFSTFGIIGGIAGKAEGTSIENCYNRGDIRSNATAIGLYSFLEATAGGIAGYITTSAEIEDKSSSIRNCYNVGDIDSSAYLVGTSNWKPTVNNGALSGVTHYESTIQNCYYLDNVSEATSSQTGILSNIKKFSSKQMKTEFSYEELDFNTLWRIDPNKNNGFPYLAWQDKG